MHPSHALWNALSYTVVGDQLSKKLAGNVVRDEQPIHVSRKRSADAGLSCGNDVMEEQPRHVR